MKFSLIIPVYNRENHLKNLLKSLRWSSLPPEEVIIVNMGERMDLSAYEDLPIHVIPIAPFNKDRLPLAKARNWGAAYAHQDRLIFLDVDCIPSGDFFKNIIAQSEVRKGLIMGTPKYLMHPLSESFTENDLRDNAVHHPYRPVIQGCELSTNPGLFWSLCFMIHKRLFNEIRGFDEHFVGYGGEDTDFSFKLRDRGRHLFLSDAEVYHQQHPVYSPPLQKFNDIVANSRYFYKKWNMWPMDAWLASFDEMGLIQWGPDSSQINILHEPDEALIASCCREKGMYS